MNLPIIRTIEELSFNAWVALQTVYYDGWLLRFADGYTRRANSVNPLYPSFLASEQKIARCETLYAAHGLDVTFKLTPAVYPDNLDDLLAQRGYQKQAMTSVQTLSLSYVPTPATDAALMLSQPNAEWLQAFCRLNSVTERHLPTMERMLTNVIPRCCFLTLHQRDEITAVGLAVLDGEYVGLLDIVTAPQWRNQGWGGQLLGHLLWWAKANGAQHAYLQVMLSNPAALHLYKKLGFAEVYQYWYRTR